MKKYIAIIRDFLTKNTSSKQTVIKNTFWLLLAEGISKGSLAILVIMIGRIFGKEIFGQYSYLSVILTFLVVFADMGLTQLAVRDYQHIDEKHRRQYLVTGLWTKILLSLAVVAVYIVILWYTADTSFLWIIGLILLTNNLTNSFLEYIRSTFRSLQKGETELRIKLIQGIGNLLLIPLLYIYESLPLNLLGQSIVTLVTIGYAWWLVRKRQLIDHHPEVMVTKGELVRNGWMFAMSGLFISVYFYIDSIIIEKYWGYEYVGIYSAAYRISLLMLIPITMFGQSLFSMLSSFKKKPKESIKFTGRRIMVILCIVFVIGPLLLYNSHNIIYYIYGDQFMGSGEVLFYLIIASLFIYINTPLGIVPQSLGLQKYFTIGTLLSLAVNIILNFIFIPVYGIKAAAIVTMITEITLFLYLILINLYIYNVKNDN